MAMAAIFIYEKEEFRNNLFGYFKARIAPDLNISRDSGLDLSELIAGDLTKETDRAEQEQEGEKDKSRAEKIIIAPEKESNKNVSLQEIKEKIEEIENKKNQIEKEVQKLIVLAEIQKNIKDLSEKTAGLIKEADNLG